MKYPQLFNVERLASRFNDPWPRKEIYTTKMSHAGTAGRYSVLVRPQTKTPFLMRLRLAIGVLIGRYDALSWVEN